VSFLQLKKQRKIMNSETKNGKISLMLPGTKMGVLRVWLQKRLCYGMIFSWLILLSFENVMAEGQSRFSKDFFSQIAPITMTDNLAVCLAVSGAYRLTQIALKSLYGEQIPVRGEIEVTFRGAVDDKVNGPISQVVTYITGAAAENGFKGFGGKKFRRYNLLRFDKKSTPPAGALCSVHFKRVDTGKSVDPDSFDGGGKKYVCDNRKLASLESFFWLHSPQLAAGIFHREEVPIEAVKEHMRDEGIET
jgi:hypothetical protein